MLSPVIASIAVTIITIMFVVFNAADFFLKKKGIGLQYRLQANQIWLLDSGNVIKIISTDKFSDAVFLDICGKTYIGEKKALVKLLSCRQAFLISKFGS